MTKRCVTRNRHWTRKSRTILIARWKAITNTDHFRKRANTVERKEMTTKRQYKSWLALEYLEDHAGEISLSELAEMFSMSSSALRNFIEANGEQAMLRGYKSNPKRPIIKKSKPITVSASIADLLLTMPPPNFSGMSNTQSRAVG